MRWQYNEIYSPQILISSSTFGLRPAVGLLCCGDRSRMRRAARARPPGKAEPKPCLCQPDRRLGQQTYSRVGTPYRVPIIALNLFRLCIDRFYSPSSESRLEFFERRTRAVARTSLVG